MHCLIPRQGLALGWGGLLFTGFLSAAAFVSPASLDSALFGPTGSGCLASIVAVGKWGLPGGVSAQVPFGSVDTFASVPSAAPLHVGGLVAAGFCDLGNDTNLAISTLLPYAALLLGGLWSRSLGPHREIWSWDVVEITAVDLFMADIAAEHTWTASSSLSNILWGGAELSLFRLGLAASHHHLSATGGFSYMPTIWLPTRQVLGATGIALFLPLWLSADTFSPLSVQAKTSRLSLTPVMGSGELSLVAWLASILAPSAGVLAAWGIWGAPLYLWLSAAPMALYLGYASAPQPQSAFWTHSPLIPLTHVFGAPLPWTFLGLWRL